MRSALVYLHYSLKALDTAESLFKSKLFSKLDLRMPIVINAEIIFKRQAIQLNLATLIDNYCENNILIGTKRQLNINKQLLNNKITYSQYHLMYQSI
jgi:hypothetical protein